MKHSSFFRLQKCNKERHPFTPSPLHPSPLSLLGDLPPRRLHARRHAGEIPNLVSRNCTFLCELPQLVDSPVHVRARAEGVCKVASATDAPPRQSLDHLVVFPLSYMVMPFVAQDLGHIMKRRRLTDRIIVYLFYQLLRGLKVTSSPNILRFLYTVQHLNKTEFTGT